MISLNGIDVTTKQSDDEIIISAKWTPDRSKPKKNLFIEMTCPVDAGVTEFTKRIHECVTSLRDYIDQKKASDD